MSETQRPTRWPAWKRVPPFLPVPLRARTDGWTPERQARFIGLLAETGSVAEAARGVGMSRMAAYRLRRRAGAESLAHAWDAIVGFWQGEPVALRKVTPSELFERAHEGEFHIRMRRQRHQPKNPGIHYQLALPFVLFSANRHSLESPDRKAPRL